MIDRFLTRKKIKYIPLILAAVLLAAVAQILLKKGMMEVGHFSFSPEHFFSTALRIAANPYILLGFSCFMAGAVLWLLVLSRVDVSFAYPFSSLGFILTTLFGFWALNENFSALRVTGVTVICIGVILVSKS